ncbi:MAG: putative integral rane protein [Acidimicrobiales bacterium]|nr:putative integral rane protein [Acidimicrobiales bacterium]
MDGTQPDRAWARPAGLLAIIVGLGMAAVPASPLWVVLGGLSLASGVGLPLLAVGAPRAARVLVPLAVAVVAVVGAWAPYARANGGGPARDRTHDGGVTVTREAARLVLHGDNPYTARYDAVLPPSWAQVQGADGDQVANPVIDHEPYLPLSFLVQIPFEVASDAVGATWDPRTLGWLALVGTAVLLARRPGPAWARVGVILVLGNAFTMTYLAWGTNDSLAACAFVAALVLARDRPGWAGAALALAVSCKFLFLVAVPPLVVVALAADGWRGVRRWWTAAALLGSSCLVFLAWSPSAFVDDVLWFNLGRTEPLMPTSGLGLPAVAGGLFHGPVLGLVTVAGAAVAFGLVPLLARRHPAPGWIGPLTSLGLLGLLVPARTFQVNYLVLVVAVAATGWWALGDGVAPAQVADADPIDRVEAATQA